MNGERQDSIKEPANLGLTWLGSSWGSREYASAVLDELKIFGEALSDADVKELAKGALQPEPVYQSELISPTRGNFITVPGIDLHATDFTIATKVYMYTDAGALALLSNEGHGSWQLYCNIAGKTFGLVLWKDTDPPDLNARFFSGTAPTPVPAKVWTHVAVTLTWGADGHTPVIKLYVSGKLDGSWPGDVSTTDPKVRNPYQLMPSSNPYTIGFDNNTLTWACDGQLKDFRVYSVALSDEQIAELANS